MSPRYLVDTNVLVYAHGHGHPAKAARATQVLHALHLARSAALPAQALAELASVALKKFKPPMAPAELQKRIELYEQTFPILPLTAPVVLEAVRGVRDYQLSYFDAQLWAVAKLSQIPVILSEDFNTGSRIEGVTFLNPFAPSFDVKTL